MAIELVWWLKTGLVVEDEVENVCEGACVGSRRGWWMIEREKFIWTRAVLCAAAKHERVHCSRLALSSPQRVLPPSLRSLTFYTSFYCASHTDYHSLTAFS